MSSEIRHCFKDVLATGQKIFVEVSDIKEIKGRTKIDLSNKNIGVKIAA